MLHVDPIAARSYIAWCLIATAIACNGSGEETASSSGGSQDPADNEGGRNAMVPPGSGGTTAPNATAAPNGSGAATAGVTNTNSTNTDSTNTDSTNTDSTNTGTATGSGGGAPIGGGGGSGSQDTGGDGSAEQPVGGQNDGGQPIEGPSSGGGQASDGQSSTSPSPLWYFVQVSDAAVLANVATIADNLKLSDLESLNQNQYPWSPDGSLVAQIEGNEVVFYSLGDASTELGRYPAGEYTAVHGWIPNFGALLIGHEGSLARLGAMKPDGTLATLNALAPVHSITIAPDGSEVVWGVGEYAAGYEVRHQSFEGGMATDIGTIGSHSGSPLLAVNWSRSGPWLSYGISTSEGVEGAGVYLWKRGLDSIRNVVPEGALFVPYFSFSADDSLFVMHVSTTSEATGLATLALENDAPGDTHLVEEPAEGISPASWSNRGSYIMYVAGDEGGVLRKIDGRGLPEPAVPFPEYVYMCQVVWFSETEFVANTCDPDATNGYLLFGEVDGQTLNTRQYEAQAEPTMVLSDDGSCVVTYNATDIRVGATRTETYSPATVTTNQGAVSMVRLAPDGSNLMWTEDGNRHYRVSLDDCVPSSAAELLLESDSAAVNAGFVGSGSN